MDGWRCPSSQSRERDALLAARSPAYVVRPPFSPSGRRRSCGICGKPGFPRAGNQPGRFHSSNSGPFRPTDSAEEPYFMMITLAVALCAWGLAYRWVSLTGGDTGIVGIPRPRVPWVGLASGTLSFYYTEIGRA